MFGSLFKWLTFMPSSMKFSLLRSAFIVALAIECFTAPDIADECSFAFYIDISYSSIKHEPVKKME